MPSVAPTLPPMWIFQSSIETDRHGSDVPPKHVGGDVARRGFGEQFTGELDRHLDLEPCHRGLECHSLEQLRGMPDLVVELPDRSRDLIRLGAHQDRDLAQGHPSRFQVPGGDDGVEREEADILGQFAQEGRHLP